MEWRAVIKGERRPYGPVIVYRKGTTPEDKLIAAIQGGSPEQSHEILIARWRDGYWRDHKKGWIVQGVTHWMPLPAPPNEKSPDR